MTYKDTIIMICMYNDVILLQWCSASARCQIRRILSRSKNRSPPAEKNHLQHTEMNKNLELPEWLKSYQCPYSFPFSFGWLYLCCSYLNAAAEIHTNILGFIDVLTFALTFAPNKSHKTMLFFRGAKR